MGRLHHILMVMVFAVSLFGLLSANAVAKSRLVACQESPLSQACLEFKRACVDDLKLNPSERYYCAREGLLLPIVEARPSEQGWPMLGINYLQPHDDSDEYTLTFDIGARVNYSQDSGINLGGFGDISIGFLKDFSLDISGGYEVGLWVGRHFYTGVYAGAGYSVIGNDVLGSAGYAPTGAILITQFTDATWIVAKGQVDWPFLGAADTRNSHGSGLGFGSEARAELGVYHKVIGLSFTYRRFLGTDWFGGLISLPVKSPKLPRSFPRCVKDAECNNNEICQPETALCVPRGSVVYHDDFCTSVGQCSPYGSSSVSISTIACRASEACTESGQCVAVNGECTAQRDADCAASRKCKRLGDCTLGEVGSCRPASKKHCAQSLQCKREGLCGYEGGECVPTKERHCKRSDLCRLRGMCSYVEGECQPYKAQHCKRSRACALFGACGFYEWSCIPTQSKHCADSKACKVQGKCEYSAELQDCKITEDRHCQKSDDCKMSGNCSYIGDGYRGRCHPAKPQHCTQSQMCKNADQCVLGDHVYKDSLAGQKECVNSDGVNQERPFLSLAMDSVDVDKPRHCKDTSECSVYGLCTKRTNGSSGCAASKPTHCRKSLVCKVRGACGLVSRAWGSTGAPFTGCAPTENTHCKQSHWCTYFGRCVLANGVCVRGD